jgi:predicted DNA binding CopG/RHH family protein
MMRKKLVLDTYEKEIEENIDAQPPIPHLQDEMGKLKKAAAMHVKRKQSITLRINVMDLEAIKLKASRVGIPYQTYINMIIHQDATSM